MKVRFAAALGGLALLVSTSAFAAEILIPEGTELGMRLEDALSSQTAKEGDRFTVSLDDNVKLPDGTILRAGYRGVGEVVEARDNGMLGKNGKLNVRLLYMKVGDDRVRLRANRGAKGETRVGATVATVILFWPAAPFIRGKDVSIKKGTVMTAYVDQDVKVASPVPPPPVSD
uniref:hypothetical protein n=1 Tax=uncultured Caulobacter sp. TaxID=158749 RepID=UPI0025FBB3EA|nr:hypothetical protein [uncultured Caulobacter sp.]